MGHFEYNYAILQVYDTSPIRNKSIGFYAASSNISIAISGIACVLSLFPSIESFDESDIFVPSSNVLSGNTSTFSSLLSASESNIFSSLLLISPLFVGFA